MSYVLCGKSADTVSDNAPTPKTLKSQKCVFIFAEQAESKIYLKVSSASDVLAV